ncbi:MAG: META domain-containing protein, partial [Synechococcales cyanobacterium T60_A2020_003]|nr:META domain-containing protein [Synechococcales cyanobacterium T60_A2020_003]
FESSDRIVGSWGCNRYFGGLTTDEESISVGAIGSTRMACPPAVMDQEARFFQALSTANRIELDGPYLLVYSEGIDQPLRFTQITPSVDQ